MRLRWRRAARLAGCVQILGLFMVVSGCGPTVGSVVGKVTFDGKPVPGGNVTVIPSSGSAQMGAIDQNGNYSISNVPTGPAKITVETASQKPTKMPSGAKIVPPKDVKAPNYDPNEAKKGIYVAIPNRYSVPEESGLALDVKSGKNEKNLDLQK